MAKDQGILPTTMRPRTPLRASPPADAAPKKRTSIAQFFREVRAEMRRVTWTSWKETWITSVMVGIMVVLAALFFFSIDEVFGYAMDHILKLSQGG